MKSSTLATAVLAASLAGCATDKPLMQQASEGFTAARTSVANAIAPTPAASAPTSSTSATATEVEVKKTGVTWNEKFAEKAKSNVVTTTGRTVATKFTSLNGEFVTVTVKDSKAGSKFAPVAQYGQIGLESCTPTLMGTASSAASTFLPGILGRVTGAAGKAAANVIPSGAVGNVVRTETSRTATAAATETKGQILNGATNLSVDQQKQCKADMSVVAAEITATGSKMAADYSKANKGSTPVVTYTGTADLKDLQLGLSTRSPK